MSVRVIVDVDLPDDPWADVDVQEIADAVTKTLTVEFGNVDYAVFVDPEGPVTL